MPTELFDLRGQGALVTGGNSGIGLAIADALAAAGADVAVWGIDPERTDTAVEHLRRHGTTIAGILCDVSDGAAVEAAFATTVERLGRVDSCFAGAATLRSSRSFLDIGLDEWHAVLRVNLDGVFLTMQQAVRHMVERGSGGSLVTMTSLSATHGDPGHQHYAASKGALISLMRGLAVEYARHRIRANVIMPGLISTPLADTRIAEEPFRTAMVPRIPLRRYGEPTELSALAVYLASPASGYHTGDVIVVDGGFSIV